MKLSVNYPTAAQLYAVEAEARRLRAQELSRLLNAAKGYFRSFVTNKEMKHA